MFEASFTRELIALGYKDGMQQRDDLVAFLGGAPLAATTVLPALKLIADGGPRLEAG
jgi:hypothetical protein